MFCKEKFLDEAAKEKFLDEAAKEKSSRIVR
jgi:hypothetical protein